MPIVEEYRNFGIRKCLNHFHISSCGHDLIDGPFKSVEETKLAIDKIIKEDEGYEEKG